MIEKMQDFSRNLVLRHAVGVKDDSQLLRIFLSSQDAVVSKFLVGYERAPFFFLWKSETLPKKETSAAMGEDGNTKAKSLFVLKIQETRRGIVYDALFRQAQKETTFFFHFYYHELKTPCMLRRINETRDRNLGNKWIVILSKSKLF